MTKQNKLTGGSVGYYQANVTYPLNIDQPPYIAECGDIIDALELTFNEACEFKAIWRTATARMGTGKPNQKALYDAEKRVYYAQKCLKKYQREVESG